jgi:hypothetical protein
LNVRTLVWWARPDSLEKSKRIHSPVPKPSQIRIKLGGFSGAGLYRYMLKLFSTSVLCFRVEPGGFPYRNELTLPSKKSGPSCTSYMPNNSLLPTSSKPSPASQVSLPFWSPPRFRSSPSLRDKEKCLR